MQLFTVYNAQHSWTVWTLVVVCYRDSYLIGFQTEIACEEFWTYTRILGRLYPEFQIIALWSGYKCMGWLIQLMFSKSYRSRIYTAE